MLVNIGRIDDTSSSKSVESESSGPSGETGGFSGMLSSIGSLFMKLIKFLFMFALACATVVVAWRGYHQAKRRGASGSSARGAGAARYEVLTTDVSDEWAESEGDAHGMEMQHTVTGYAPQQEDSTVAGV